MYVLRLFQVTTGSIHSFQIHSKEMLQIMYPENPDLDMIQRIHLCCGSFGSMICFWILVKKHAQRQAIRIEEITIKQFWRHCKDSGYNFNKKT